MTIARYFPDLEGWLFAVKSFAAAMLALTIALAVGLDRPYWAMATVYIVANPLTGAIRSKAVYRLAGTLAGAAATLALVPNLDNAPELLSLALAAWIGVCLYLSVLDRTPRGYAFMLAGYTTALIGFPIVTTPGAVWDIAVSRVEEITLGIICATIVGTVVFPRPVGPVLSARLGDWLRGADRLILNAIAAPDGETAEPIGPAAVRLAASAAEIRSVATHLAYDTSHISESSHEVAALARRMVMLLPVSAALRDRLADLRAAGGITRALHAVLEQTRTWIAGGTGAHAPRAGIAALQDRTDTMGGWDGALQTTVLVRLRELVDLRQDCLDLERHIAAARPHRAAPPLAIQVPERAAPYREHGLALLRAGSAALAILLTCAFWIATAWPDGSQAAALAAVACCFTAARDDPVPSINALLTGIILSSILAAIGQFVVLPQATNYEMLILALAAFFLPAGALGVTPATQKLAILPVFTAVLLALESSYSADFAAWANGTAAAVAGVAAAAAVTGLVVPSGAAWAVRRRLRAGWADLAAAARGATAPERLRLVGLFLDRMGLLAPQMAAAPTERAASFAAMTDLRVGVNLVDLNAARAAMPPRLGRAVDIVLRRAAAFFTARAGRGGSVAAPPRLLRSIDRALNAVSDMGGETARQVVLALVGLRCNLFPDAAPFAAARHGETA
jgi:uncharacterized membrane protein YccC